MLPRSKDFVARTPAATRAPAVFKGKIHCAKLFATTLKKGSLLKEKKKCSLWERGKESFRFLTGSLFKLKLVMFKDEGATSEVFMIFPLFIVG